MGHSPCSEHNSRTRRLGKSRSDDTFHRSTTVTIADSQRTSHDPSRISSFSSNARFPPRALLPTIERVHDGKKDSRSIASSIFLFVEITMCKGVSDSCSAIQNGTYPDDDQASWEAALRYQCASILLIVAPRPTNAHSWFCGQQLQLLRSTRRRHTIVFIYPISPHLFMMKR